MLTSYMLDKYFDRLLDINELQFIPSDYHKSETDGSVTIEMVATGILKEDLKVSVEENVLTVEAKPQKKTFLTSSFKRSWTLGENIDSNNISAKLENGLLVLTLPKIKPQKKTISISVA